MTDTDAPEDKPKRQKYGGRTQGTPNRTTAMIKDAILQAAIEAGGDEGMVGYMKMLAKEEPKAFATLLGKVLPHQIAHEVPPDTEIHWSFEVVSKPNDNTESENPVH